MDKKVIVAVWCGIESTKLMASVHGLTMLELVCKRVGPHVCLIPWALEFDALFESVTSVRRRCHPDQRIAMRDLVAELDADIGILVQGDCGSIDRAEVQLARARISSGHWTEYRSPRVMAGDAKFWLQCSDTDDWPVPKGPEELRQILKPDELTLRMRMAMDRLK